MSQLSRDTASEPALGSLAVRAFSTRPRRCPLSRSSSSSSSSSPPLRLVYTGRARRWTRPRVQRRTYRFHVVNREHPDSPASPSTAERSNSNLEELGDYLFIYLSSGLLYAGAFPSENKRLSVLRKSFNVRPWKFDGSSSSSSLVFGQSKCPFALIRCEG